MVVEAFRPGVAKRLGIDYETLSAEHPGLVYCSISAFGQPGHGGQTRPRYRDRRRRRHSRCHAITRGRLRSRDYRRADSGHVVFLSCPVGGTHGTPSSSYNRTRRFCGYQHVRIGPGSQPQHSGACLRWRAGLERLKERTHGGNAMLNVYETADKHYIALGGGEHKFVEAYLKVWGDLSLLPR